MRMNYEENFILIDINLWCLSRFLINNDFIGKTIILFRTSSASVFITEDIERLAPNATWLEG